MSTLQHDLEELNAAWENLKVVTAQELLDHPKFVIVFFLGLLLIWWP